MRQSVQLCAVAVTLFFFAGCTAPPTDPIAAVSQTITERTGQRVIWNRSSTADAEASAAVDELLSRELTAESAVQVALLNNRSLQATFEDLGIAQADLVQAGLLKNPMFEAKIKYADAGGGTALELNAVAEFLDILLIPLRKRAAEANFAFAQQRVTAEVLSLASETKKAFYEAQAATQTVDAWRTVLLATDASATFARKMHEAGNMSDLDLAQELVLHERAKLDAARAEIVAIEMREKLVGLMGLWGPRVASIRLPERLPDPPAADIPAAGLETLAMENRADLHAARAAVDAAAVAAGVPRPLRWLEGGELGATAERGDAGGWEVGPIIAVPIPLFDTGAAAAARRNAELRQASQRHAALAVEIRSQVRTAWARVSSAHQRAAFYRNTLLPLRARVVEQTQLHYNAMHTGVTQLLMAKQEQIKAGMEYVDAIRMYWVARAELEHAVGGTLPGESFVPPPATRPATQPASTAPAHQHHH